MEVIAKAGSEDLALVYLARKDEQRIIEFVEALQPPVARDKKWVLIISTMFGCPVKCRFCDAGGFYRGKLSADEIMFQIDYLISRRFPDGHVPVNKFKVQFARLGEPSMNDAVLEVLERLARRNEAPGLMPCVSTIAPTGRERFFDRLTEIKKEYFDDAFQLQFSVHTTDRALRDWLMPVRKWDLPAIADYGNAFFGSGGRKITLNFALAEGIPVEAGELLKHFSPDRFLLKITPLNPTTVGAANAMRSYVRPDVNDYPLLDGLRKVGYEVLLSIGEWEENKIGSNCGQYITQYLRAENKISDGYTYPLVSLKT